ncbi:MAG TPA: hypothetical protein VMY35_13265 [Phycisphaerae bacterium]|nr:hypothetical protein [Phycisphaerae bacterium]
MADCHIETFLEQGWRRAAGMYRAQAVHTATGRVLYVTWPYASKQSAIDRARRWLRQEYARAEGEDMTLFPGESA